MDLSITHTSSSRTQLPPIGTASNLSLEDGPGGDSTTETVMSTRCIDNSDSVARHLRRVNASRRICDNIICDNDDPVMVTVVEMDERGFPSHVKCKECGEVMRATCVDIGVLTLLRRHSTEGTLCDNVMCAMDDPSKLDVVGNHDEFGFIGHVRCTVCGQLMSTRCYDYAGHRKMRVLSGKELRAGDHIAWHNSAGHWHNMIFLESHGEEQDGLTTLISVIEYHFRFLCDNRVVQSVRRVNFNVLDVYRIIYADAYTDSYSLDRARSLTRPGTKVNPLKGSCEYYARWCKTGHRVPLRKRIVHKFSLDREEMSVIRKTSTLVSLAIANGIIPNKSNEIAVYEAIIFTVIPVIILFFSVVFAQVRREYYEIEPRRENLIVASGSNDVTPSNTGSHDDHKAEVESSKTTKKRRKYAGDRRKWCATYVGALTRVFVCEMIAMSGPVATFVGVGYGVRGTVSSSWLVALIALVCSVFACPPSYAIGAVIGTAVERYCVRCECCVTESDLDDVVHQSRKQSTNGDQGSSDKSHRNEASVHRSAKNTSKVTPAT